MEETDWNRAWSPEEIVQHADNWSLAGDAALLNTIKKFAENLQTNTDRISKRLDDLLHNLDETGLQLDLARNKFHSLRNVQFVESRVYEDDETLDSKTEEKDVEKNAPEDEQEIIDSIETGMKILDEYYDKIEVSVSDSEDESEQSFVLQLKDKYSHRPLPPIIGTEEWYKNDLDEDSSDSGSDQVSEVQSESESEDESPKKLIKGSETSSEFGFSSHVNEAGASQKDDRQEESASEGPPLSFAEQLAAKLGDIISQEEEVPSPEVNTKPIQPKKSSVFTDLFSDEPPPLDDPEDLQKNVKTRLFSGGKGLFDDNEDEELWHEDGKSANIEKKEEPAPKSVQVTKGLFDNDQSSDEDIFSPPKLSKQPFLKSEKPNIPLFADEPPVFEKKAEETPKKKPAGAVSLFGSRDLFDDLLKQTQKKDDMNKNIISEKKQRKNLFDDDNDDDLVLPKAKSTKNLNTFDESNNSKFENETNTEQPIGNHNKGKSKRISLFDNDDDDIPEVKNESKPNLFSEEGSPEQSIFDDREPLNNIFENNPAKRKSKKISLFDDDEEWNIERGIPDIASTKVQERPKLISLFDDEDEIESKGTESGILNREKPSEKRNLREPTKQETSKKVDLFDDDDKDDIEAKGTESSIFNIKKSDISINTEEQKKQKSNISLFDEEETESENTEYIVVDKTHTEENIETHHQEIPKKVTLFDDDENEVENKETNSSIFNKNTQLGTVINKEQPTVGSNKQPKKISLFDDEDDLFKNDIFANLEASFPSKLADLDDDLFKREKTKVEENTEDKSRQSPIPFSMSPPPDDEGESDTGSDRTLSEQEDISSYRGIADSIVFYDEPPFLDSGVATNSPTRLSSLDSTFNPSAMSSRRLSSDIFNEEESIDEFFLTKNKAEESGSHLNVIPEHVNNPSSFLDFTPSGHPEDFDTMEHDSMEPPMKSDTTPEDHPKGKITSITELLKSESEKKIESKDSTVAPGKLKHNLNINVNALMPGSTHPHKLKDIQKSQSLETDTVDNSSDKRSHSFDETVGNVEVLQSITKGRARIPIKRKPSTRRGRQAGMAYQQDEGKSDAKDEAPEVVPKSSPEKTLHDPNLLLKEESTSTDQPSTIFPKEISTESVSSPQQPKRPLFDDEDSDQDVFRPKQASSMPTRKSLFNDSTSSSEEDDLFKSATSQKNEVPKSVLSKGTHKGSILKKLENVETSEDPLSNLLS